MSRIHDLTTAQATERHTLAVLHFEQGRVTRARAALWEAEEAEATARARHMEAKDAREQLERPDVGQR